MLADDSLDDVLAAAVASGRPRAEVAKMGGVSEATVYRRLRESAFRRKVWDFRGDMIAAALGALAEASTVAVSALASIAGDAAQEPAVRVRAAAALLDSLVSLREHVELAQRVEALEAGPTRGQAA